MAKKITNVDEWNAALNPRTYQGPDDEEPANYGDGGCGGCCTMPSCLQPKVEYKSVSGSAYLAGFTGTSGSDSGSAAPGRFLKLVETKKNISSHTFKSYYPNTTTEYVSLVASTNEIYKKESTYSAAFEAQIGLGELYGCPQSARSELSVKYSGGGSRSSQTYGHYVKDGAWARRLEATVVTTITCVDGENNSTTSAPSDEYSGAVYQLKEVITNELTGQTTNRETYHPVYFDGVTPDQYESKVDISAALAEAEAWLDSQASTLLAGDSEATPAAHSSDSSDSTLECAIGSHYIASTTVRDDASSPASIQLVTKSYFKYRFKLHRCSGQYSGLSWLEIFYSNKLQDWLNPYNPGYHVGTRPAGPATTRKSWEGAGTNTNPRCRAGTSQPYADDEIYANAALWSPWSLLVSSSPSAGDGSKYLTAMHIACYRSIYGTVPTKVNGYGDYNSDE